MPNFKSNLILAIFSFLLFFVLAGPAMANPLAIIDDAVDFALGTPTVFIEGTAGGTGELAEVPFTIDFHEGVVPDGNISKVVVKFQYDPAFLTLESARPSSDWGELTENVDYFLIHNMATGVVQFTIFPEIEPVFPVVSDVMTLAYFDFSAKCQAQENPNSLDFTSIDEITSECSLDVELTGGGRNSYIPLLSYTTNGSVTTEFYWVKTKAGSKTHRGILGTEITVPVQFQSNCNIDGITFQMEYDQTKLHFIGLEDWITYFPAGFTAGTAPEDGDFPIYISLNTGPAYDIPASDGGEFLDIFKLRFEAIGDWDGDYTIVKWSTKYVDVDREFRVGDGTSGYCEEVTNSLPLNPDSYWFLAGWQYLDEYAATMQSQMADNTIVWNTPGTNQDIDFNISLCNNFEAGTYVTGYDGAITAIVDPPDIFNFNFDLLTPVPGLGVAFDWAYSSESHDTISIYQDYESSGFDNVLDISACNLEGAIDILNLTFELDDDEITGFTSDEYALDFAATTSTFAGETKVEASQWSKTLLPGDGLDTVAVPFRVATGEFSCDLKSSSTYSVDQQYYVRNSFDLASFQVTVAITSGPHYVNTVTPASGVDYVIEAGNKSVTFTSNSEWVPTENDTRSQFAQIHFNNLLPPPPSKVDPGTDCYWRHTYSTIELQEPFMSDLMSDDPANPQGNLPFLFTSANSIRKSTLICPEPRDDQPQDLKLATEVIPTEFNLYQNYPNPFNPDTKISFDLPAPTRVSIEIFNILGQHVKTLIDETKAAGSYDIIWNSTDETGQKVSSGIYLYVMRAGDYSNSTKMILMK